MRKDNKIVSISDFAPEDSFFDDLREGKFCLVLGAGFSFGVKNCIEEKDVGEINEELKRIGSSDFLHFDLCKTIPIGKDFVDISNILFNERFEKTDYRLAANIWSNFKLNSDFDLSDFFRKLFTADKKYIEDNIELLESIFIPKWHNIYTLNFDTVLEEIIAIRNLSCKYKIYSYPEEPGFETRPSMPLIAHLHGTILTKDLGNLVFSDSSFTKIRSSQQSLYDNLHAEIKSGKKILIVGTQFNDSVIDDKLIHDIPDFIFYHFDTEHNIIKGKKFANNTSTSNYITLFKDPKNQGTELFLQFLKEKEDKIENIYIEGAEVINKSFIDKIEKEGKEKNFQPADFYLAKQTDNCQWYGIQQGWDADRKEYNVINSEVFKSFKDDNNTAKVLGLVLGRGGSGKSTLLRRLAVDLSKQIFAVIWVNDKQIESFSKNGISQFSYYPHKQFIVIIEDWYRIKKNLKENAASVINSLCDCPNVRVLIGDRTLDTTVKNNLNNPDKNQFLLKAKDNDKLIPKILGKIKEWESTANELLKTPDDYNSSLYLILWTIGRTHILKGTRVLGTIQQENLKSHFQSIVRSDLKAIYKTAPGFAKAIYYLAKVYATNKIYITFEIFEQIAFHFNGNEKIFNGYYSIDNETKEMLDIYINHSQSSLKSARDLTFVAFNHDILAEEGLVESDFDKVEVQEKLICDSFSDGIKKQMLDIIIEKGDDFSVSSFLYYYLATIHPSAITKEEKLNYIETQFSKGNSGSYLNHLFYKNELASDKTKNIYAEKILNDYKVNFFEKSTICHCLKIFTGIPFATQLLERFKTEKLDHQIICNCLINLKGKAEGISFATQLLERFRTEKLDHQIICNCLINLKDKAEGIPFATQLLERFIEKKEVHPYIICNCLINLKDKAEGISFATQLLERFIEKKDVHPNIICNCLINLKDKAEGISFATQLLERFIEKKDVAREIICNCLINLKDKAEGIPFATQLLERFIEKKDVHPDIICNCFINLKDKAEGISFATQLLERFIEKKDVHPNIICNCLINLKDKAEGIPFATQLLERFIEKKDVHPDIICNCLINLKDKAEGISFATQLLERFKTEKLDHKIICNCLINLKDKAEGISFATQLLERFIEKKDVAREIISNCLQNLRDSETGKYYATHFLKNKDWKKENWSFVYHSLTCFSKDTNPPEFVVKIVDQIISDNDKKLNIEKGSYFFYKNLMKIPFHHIQTWEIENYININTWSSRKRDLAVSTIIANQNYSEEIKEMCVDILSDWQAEILISIPSLKKDEVHKGDHIKLALGHPYLKTLAMSIAKEMAKVEEKNPKTLPDYLLEIILQIVNKEEFPEWNINIENGSNTQ